MKTSHRRAAWFTSLLLVSAAALALRSRPIPKADARAVASADLAAVPAVEMCWVELARNETWGQVGTSGLTRAGTWDITVSGLLVRHPRGHLVVDVGNSSHFEQEIAAYPFFRKKWLELLPGSNRVVATAPDALRAMGVDVDALTVVVSHMHVDHAGGLVDLPNAKVLMPQEEIAFAAARRNDDSFEVVPAHARALDGRTTALAFTAKPYETFDESADVFGDGSVVVVKLGGHTPGSVGVFVNVSPSVRVFHVGDAVNLVEAVERRLTKSVVMATTDLDGHEADRAVARIAQLHDARPEIAILPAHDRPAWAGVFGRPGACRH